LNFYNKLILTSKEPIQNEIMKFSTPAVAALVSFCLSTTVRSAASAAAASGPTRLKVRRNGALRQQAKQQRGGRVSNKYSQTRLRQNNNKNAIPMVPLWEQTPKETEVDHQMIEHNNKVAKETDFLGILAHPNHNHDRVLVVDEEEEYAVSCAVFAEEGYDCNCDGFDEITSTGTFACVITDESMTISVSYEIRGPEDLTLDTLLVLADGGSYSYGATYEGGVATQCTASVNGCACQCDVGMCPGESEPAIVNIYCPNLLASEVDICSDNLFGDMEYQLSQAETCNGEDGDAAAAIGTMVPSMGDTMGGTAMESAVMTMATTEVGVDTSVQKAGGTR